VIAQTDGSMLSLPPLLRDALREFSNDYLPGRMLSNYGDSHIPSPESIDCVKKWFSEMIDGMPQKYVVL